MDMILDKGEEQHVFFDVDAPWKTMTQPRNLPELYQAHSVLV